jgi:hypothetical protein
MTRYGMGVAIHLNVVDDFNRETPLIEIGFNQPAPRIIRVPHLEQVAVNGN